jgi:hypothetical protein
MSPSTPILHFTEFSRLRVRQGTGDITQMGDDVEEAFPVAWQ